MLLYKERKDKKKTLNGLINNYNNKQKKVR